MSILAVIIGIVTSVVSAELLHRRGVDRFTTRKIAHIGGSLSAAMLPWATNVQTAVAIGLCATVLLVVIRWKRLLPGILSDANDIGPVLLPVGLTAAALLFWQRDPLIYQLSACVVGISDGCSALVGRRFGKHGYVVTGKKTFEGSAAFFLCTLAIFFIAAPGATAANLGAAFVLTLLEAAFARGFDNLVLPVATGMLVFWLR